MVKEHLGDFVGFVLNASSLTLKGTGASADTEFPQHAVLVSPQLYM